jgi:hypothetical protein
MEESKKVTQFGQQARALRPGEQMQVNIDLDKTTQKVCECGDKFFVPAVTVHTVSAILSPTGQELVAQVAVLVCMECKTALK